MKLRSTTSPAEPNVPKLLPSTMISTPPALPIRSVAIFPWNWRAVPAGNVPSMLTLPSTVTLSQEGAEKRTSSGVGAALGLGPGGLALGTAAPRSGLAVVGSGEGRGARRWTGDSELLEGSAAAVCRAWSVASLKTTTAIKHDRDQ